MAEPLYKFGSTQVNIAPESVVGLAMAKFRKGIKSDHLMGDGIVHDAHVTVRYGIAGDRTAAIESYLSQQKPFTVSLGKTASFPPSEHSDGAAPVIIKVDSPELHRINKGLEATGLFKPSDFPYSPHATLAYVAPQFARLHTDSDELAGNIIKVNKIAISDRNGKQQEIKLAGVAPSIAAARQAVLDRFTECGAMAMEAHVRAEVRRQATKIPFVDLLVEELQAAVSDAIIDATLGKKHSLCADLLCDMDHQLEVWDYNSADCLRLRPLVSLLRRVLPDK